MTRQDAIELLEGYLINHFRISDYEAAVKSAISELDGDSEYSKEMEAVFFYILNNKNFEENQLRDIIRGAANWFVTSDNEALKKLQFIYEDTLEKVIFVPTSKSTKITQHPLIYKEQQLQQKQWLNIDIKTVNIEELANTLEEHYLQLVDKYSFFSQLSIVFGISVLARVLAFLPKESKEEKVIQEAIDIFYNSHRVADLSILFNIILKIIRSDLLENKSMSLLDMDIIVMYSLQILDEKNLSGCKLYDWFDLIFEGEAISNNVLQFGQLMYEWVILDVLPNASQKQLPRYILIFDEFIPTQEYLLKLTKNDKNTLLKR